MLRNTKIAGPIKNRFKALVLENSLVGSIRFSKSCKVMGLEPSVILCIAEYDPRLPVVGLKARLVYPHFYTEVLGKRYEVSDKLEGPSPRRPRVLVILATFWKNAND